MTIMNNFMLELNNLDEMNKFLKGYKLLKPSQEEIKPPKQSYINLRNKLPKDFTGLHWPIKHLRKK